MTLDKGKWHGNKGNRDLFRRCKSVGWEKAKYCLESFGDCQSEAMHSLGKAGIWNTQKYGWEKVK